MGVYCNHGCLLRYNENRPRLCSDLLVASISKVMCLAISVFVVSYLLLSVLPECLKQDDILIGEIHARNCCVATEESVYYSWNGQKMPCVGKQPLRGTQY